jgi:hypothetical protein
MLSLPDGNGSWVAIFSAVYINTIKGKKERVDEVLVRQMHAESEMGDLRKSLCKCAVGKARRVDSVNQSLFQQLAVLHLIDD